MTKIMLVEDDKSLREIYSIRLVAEGYDIVSAGDGEEALAMAVREKPDLILSDVMMPKISGFDMLDILRSTEETKDIKIIMMTALSSEEQRQRGENLGADRYLVKSQVGIEDVINSIHEVLGDKPTIPNPAANLNVAAAVVPARAQASGSAPAALPAAPTANPVSPVAQTDPQQIQQAQAPQQVVQATQQAAQQTTQQVAQAQAAQQAAQVAQQVNQQVAQLQAMQAQQVSQQATAQQAAQAQAVQTPQVVQQAAQASPSQAKSSQKVIQPLAKPAESAGQMTMEQRIAQELAEANAGGTAQ